MPSIQERFDKAHNAIDAAYERGELSAAEYREELLYLQREYRESAIEAAEEAYRNELDQW